MHPARKVLGLTCLLLSSCAFFAGGHAYAATGAADVEGADNLPRDIVAVEWADAMNPAHAPASASVQASEFLAEPVSAPPAQKISRPVNSDPTTYNDGYHGNYEWRPTQGRVAGAVSSSTIHETAYAPATTVVQAEAVPGNAASASAFPADAETLVVADAYMPDHDPAAAGAAQDAAMTTPLAPVPPHTLARAEFQPPPTVAPEVLSEDAVDLVADHLQHDDATQTITATGNVRLVQAGQSLKADKITYNLATDEATATGHVIMTQPNGDVHFAEEARLNNKMSTGFVQGVKTYLAEGGRFTAEEGERQGEKVIMKNASYTPCDCDGDEGRPGWQVKAREATYHRDENRISYRNAHLEVLGVPVIWTPYLSHSDGTVDRKSGFLTPSFGFDSDLGFLLTNQYYWSIDEDKDATFGLMYSSKQNPVALGEYRQRFANAQIELNGSVTQSDYMDRVAGQKVLQEDETRGHLFAEGRWDINEKWRAGTNLELTSDDQYLRQYDFRHDDVLENEIYLERFSGRDYSVARALAFQDVRVESRRVEQPNVLPEIISSFKGDPNAFLGGRWSLDMAMLGLQRDGDGQDMNRLMAQTGWQTRHVTDFGLVNTLDLAANGSLYYVSDRDIAFDDSGRSSEGKAARFYPYANMVSSYPLAKPMDNMQVVVEPIAGLMVAPKINVETSDIPNEDSLDVQIDASNLFNPSRFPGYDRVEDGIHATYGVRTGFYGYSGNHLDFFLGQSYRFDEENNPFPEGSGLDAQKSDIVGQISAGYGSTLALNYRFQLDNDDLAAERHELSASTQWSRVAYNMRYLFTDSLEGTGIQNTREQISNNVSLGLTDNWRVRGGALHDLGDDGGLRKAIAGLEYIGCCITFSVTAQRSLTSNTSGDNGTDVMFRLGLKGIGEFGASQTVGATEDRRDSRRQGALF